MSFSTAVRRKYFTFVEQLERREFLSAVPAILPLRVTPIAAGAGQNVTVTAPALDRGTGLTAEYFSDNQFQYPVFIH